MLTVVDDDDYDLRPPAPQPRVRQPRTAREDRGLLLMAAGTILQIVAVVEFMVLWLLGVPRLGTMITIIVAAVGFVLIWAGIIVEYGPPRLTDFWYALVIVALVGSVTAAFTVGYFTQWWLGLIIGAVMLGGGMVGVKLIDK